MKAHAQRVKRAIPAVAIAGLLAACAQPLTTPEQVMFAPGFSIVSGQETGQPGIYDLRVDPRFADFAQDVLQQRYSMLGRQDLAARTSHEYSAVACEPHSSGASGEDAVLAEIVRQARDARVVIVNESHTISRHRGFSRRLVETLRPLGFTHFAAETFTHPADATAPVEAGIALPYPRDLEGHYLIEPAFGRLWRTARDLGYAPIAYEQNTERDEGASRDERVAAREAFQAQALAEAIEEAGPDARFIIHVGYSHASEHEGEFGPVWMAGRLKALTGIDPLTISQVQCRQETGSTRLAADGSDRLGQEFDIFVDHPVTRFEGHRPLWRAAAGDIRVRVPDALLPSEGAHVIEARLAGEPDEAIPMDRVLVFPGEEVDLLLPPGHYRLRAVVATTENSE
ncbi:hypothetical protein [Aurantiacibacter sp. MUD61]|uniref:hypothetical protein n=1 Tax=Aurantiacibacter sp. MUD61 TaxID=3009083 RepID=UPI0022F099DC|nr:hypothetical protein [Aurantiacibacter sp. MUD61]